MSYHFNSIHNVWLSQSFVHGITAGLHNEHTIHSHTVKRNVIILLKRDPLGDFNTPEVVIS